MFRKNSFTGFPSIRLNISKFDEGRKNIFYFEYSFFCPLRRLGCQYHSSSPSYAPVTMLCPKTFPYGTTDIFVGSLKKARTVNMRLSYFYCHLSHGKRAVCSDRPRTCSCRGPASTITEPQIKPFIRLRLRPGLYLQ